MNLGKDIVEICQAGDPVEAHAVRNLLEQEGIAARVVGEALGSALGGLSFGNKATVAIWVAEEDAERAAELIAQWRESREIYSTGQDAVWLQFGMRMLLVNMTLLAVAFAILRLVPVGERAGLGFHIGYLFVFGNMLALAYYCKKRKPC